MGKTTEPSNLLQVPAVNTCTVGLTPDLCSQDRLGALSPGQAHVPASTRTLVEEEAGRSNDDELLRNLGLFLYIAA